MIVEATLRRTSEGQWAEDTSDGKSEEDGGKWMRDDREMWSEICNVISKLRQKWGPQLALKKKTDAKRKRRILAKKTRSAGQLKLKPTTDNTATGNTSDDVNKTQVAVEAKVPKAANDMSGHTAPPEIRILDKSKTAKSTTVAEETNHRDRNNKAEVNGDSQEADSPLVAMTSHLLTADEFIWIFRPYRRAPVAVL